MVITSCTKEQSCVNVGDVWEGGNLPLYHPGHCHSIMKTTQDCAMAHNDAVRKATTCWFTFILLKHVPEDLSVGTFHCRFGGPSADV